MRAIAEFLLEFASTKWGPIAMVAHSFFESFILPLAHELFLIPVSLAKPHLSFLYALMSTTASIFGISVGYGIGRRGGRALILKFMTMRTFALAKREIHKYDAWAVAFACFAPVPVKVFALVAGAVHLRFRKMIAIAFFARGARYFLVSLLLYFYGSSMKKWILDYMGWTTLGFILIMVLPVIIWKIIEKYLLKKEHLE